MEIRADLGEAHDLAWEHLAGPGSWWTGAQRVELATTVLSALADAEPIPPWGSISSVIGRIPDNPTAPAAAHDVAYRITKHAGTLTADWYAKVTEELGPLPYVELVGIVTTVAAVSSFCRSIGATVPELPAPAEGEPTGDVPDSVVQPELNWVPVADPADQTAAVVQAYSAVPGEFDNLWRMATAQYMPVDQMFDPSWSRREGGLSRPQTELIASRVAQLRECFY